MRTNMLLEKMLSIYLNGGLVKSLEGDINIFDTSENLLLLGYEQFGTQEEHSLFEKYYPVGANKGFTFKVYFYENTPWMSGLSFFRFKLDFFLNLARAHLKKIDVFFDESSFEEGALVINDICTCKFEFIKNKYPRALTLGTDVMEGKSLGRVKSDVEIISSQLLKIEPDSPLKEHPNVRGLFETIEKYCCLP